MAVKEICQRKPFIFGCLLVVVVASYLLFHLSGWTTLELTHTFLNLSPYISEGISTISTACVGNTASCMEASTETGQGSSTAGDPSSAGPASNILLVVLNSNRTTRDWTTSNRTTGEWTTSNRTTGEWTTSNRTTGEWTTSNRTTVPASNSSLAVRTTESSRLAATSQTESGEAVSENLANSTSCSSLPKNLTGRILISTEPVNAQQLLTKYPYIEVGGRLRPQTCLSDQKVAIIIPYRDRSYHLHALLNQLIPFLHRQLADAVIFVVEQAEPTIFNRGSLFNIGFLESQKLGSFDCVILHDVDMIPTHDSCLYRCGDNPRHFISSFTSRGIPYELYFGGVVGMRSEQYQHINGHSNLFFGWGGEDDDLFMRCQNKGYKYVRYPVLIGQYFTFKHSRDKGNTANPDRFRLLRTTNRRQDDEGLNTVVYQLEKLEQRPLYTWIYVSLDMKQILKTAPDYMKDDMVFMLRGIK